MGFRLSQAVARLDFDFENGCKGTVPEPSTEAVNEFQYQMTQGLQAIGVEVEDGEDMASVIRTMQALTVDQLNQMTEHTIDALCALTQNTPTHGELKAVGHRALQAFTGWLMGELSNPEGKRPATKR